MPLEIERRFLVDDKSLPTTWPVPVREYLLVQDYLSAAPGSSRRIRSSTPLGGAGHGVTFTHTRKTRPPDAPPGIQEEDEEEVTSFDYARLLLVESAPKRVTVRKIRHVFSWPESGWVFELDVFLRPFGGLVILEVELPDLAADVELPPFLTVTREVTADRRYSNASLSKLGRIP